MNESVNIASEAIEKSDESRKWISQKSAKFSIDSLLASTENETTLSRQSGSEDVECSGLRTFSRFGNSNSNCKEDVDGEGSAIDEHSKKDSEVVSTTEGFYQRNFNEGNYFLCYIFFIQELKRIIFHDLSEVLL